MALPDLELDKENNKTLELVKEDREYELLYLKKEDGLSLIHI